MPKVIIYTTPTCPYCEMSKAFFDKHGISYTEHDVATDPIARDESRQKSGMLAVPVTDIDGTIVVGFDPHAFSDLLQLNEK